MGNGIGLIFTAVLFANEQPILINDFNIIFGWKKMLDFYTSNKKIWSEDLLV